MKHFITATLAALTLAIVTLPLQAQEPVSEPAMMLYYSMPFGGHSRKQEIPTYGFRMDNLESESGITFASFNGKPAMMDFAMNEDGPQGLSFNGVNSLVKTTVYNADEGTTETTTAIDLGLVAIGIIGVIAIANNDDDDDNCSYTPTFTVVYGIDPCRLN